MGPRRQPLTQPDAEFHPSHPRLRRSHDQVRRLADDVRAKLLEEADQLTRAHGKIVVEVYPKGAGFDIRLVASF
jgi:hypothetical protein